MVTTARSLSMTELAAVVLRHFPKDLAPTAVAIAWHESRGNTAALNDKNNSPAGSRDRGIWQINDYWNPQVTDACAFDPDCATAAAAALYQKAGWTPWATFARGAYLPFLESAEAAVAQASAAGASSAGGSAAGYPTGDDTPVPPGTPVGGPEDWILDKLGDIPVIGGIVDGARSVASFGTDALRFIVKALRIVTSADFWKRAAMVAGGAVLVGIVLAIIYRRELGAVAGAGAGIASPVASAAATNSGD
jgi:hypothetical protein